MKKLLLIFFVALLCSCSISVWETFTPEKPQIHNIQIASNSIGADLKMEVYSKRRVKFSNTDLSIFDKKGSKIGILQVDDIQIKKGPNQVNIPLRLYISTSPLKIMSIIKSGDLDNLQVKGSVKVKSGLFCKRIKIDNLEQIIDIYLGQIISD